MIEYILFGTIVSIEAILILVLFYKVINCNEKVMYLYSDIYTLYNRRKAQTLKSECTMYLKYFEKRYIDYFNKIYTKVDERKYMNTNKVLVMDEPKFYNIECYKYSNIIKRYFPQKVIKVIHEDNTVNEYIFPFVLVDKLNVIRIVETSELKDFLNELKRLYLNFEENNV